MNEKQTVTKLPPPKHSGPVSLEEAIAKRRSVRRFTTETLTPAEISQVLWAALGMTAKGRFRAAPSAGAVYPLDIYAALPEGLFKYDPKTHSLSTVGDDDVRPELAVGSFGQDFIALAGLVVIIVARYKDIRKHYGERGIRYADMEAGHIAQNILLEAAALGLGSVPVGAFSLKEVRSLLKLGAKEEPVYLLPVGHAGWQGSV